MNFNVKEIQYLNRDYCQLFSKPLVYLHYVDHAGKYPNAAYQHVLKKEPFNDETTNESIITEFKDFVGGVVNVSQKCRLMTFVKDFKLEYPDIIDDVEVYPNYRVECVDLSNGSDLMPELGVVWEINRIAPALCGMLFENIIADCVGAKEKVYDLSSSLVDAKSNVEAKTIEGLVERNFIDRGLLHRNKRVKMTSKKILMVGDEKLKQEHFISKWHYLVFLSLRHFMKRELKGSDVENVLNVLDYIKTNMEDMESYYYDMLDSSLVKALQQQTGLSHGEAKRDKDLHGEVDFITDESIVDIKCYKEEECDNWFGQLWLYEKLFGKRKNLWIVNVYNNKIYRFFE